MKAHNYWEGLIFIEAEINLFCSRDKNFQLSHVIN